MGKKKIKIAFDLDGVIIDKPPFVPSWLIERFVRVKKNKELAYRFPICKVEQFIRRLSHMPLFRPAIKGNLEFIKKLSKKKNIKLYIISSRYSFLKNRTFQWLKENKIENCFAAIYLNSKNEQPHIFKERIIKKIGVDIFIDDDLPLVEYLKNRVQETEAYCFKNNHISQQDKKIIQKLCDIPTVCK